VPADLISVSDGGCGGSWHLAVPGWHTFGVHTAAAEAAEVNLVDPANDAVYAEAEALGPGTTSPMRLNVGWGSYAFRCLFEDFDPLAGPTVVVGGHARGSPAIPPVTSNDLLAPGRQYHDWVAAGLDTLASQTAAVAADVRRGDVGAAYDAFGDFGQKIDGRPDGLAGGVSSAQWTGFYRLEYGLWHGQGARQLTPIANALAADTRGRRAAWPAFIGLHRPSPGAAGTWVA
jgi:iron uptake system component EfeO